MPWEADSVEKFEVNRKGPMNTITSSNSNIVGKRPPREHTSLTTLLKDR
jgi:hypothetical protein